MMARGFGQPISPGVEDRPMYPLKSKRAVNIAVLDESINFAPRLGRKSLEGRRNMKPEETGFNLLFNILTGAPLSC